MSNDRREEGVFLSVPGAAADHLYREGSIHASFWETIFGSSLRAKKRARVSALADGTRLFDVPLLGVEDVLLSAAHLWMSSTERAATCMEAATALANRHVQVSLIGLQPQGQAIAAFTLRFEPTSPPNSDIGAIGAAFRSWFAAEGPAVAQKTLVPFGFTPHVS